MANRINYGLVYAFVMALALFNAGIALAQTTAFTYQGKLTDNGTPASGNYDLTFKLFDTAAVGSGTQQGTALSLTNVAVSAGVFTVQLDFGACASCFNGAARYLEISVKPTSGSTFTTLAPRQPITSTPYTIKSLSAVSADGLSVACVSCVTSSQIQSVQGGQVTGSIAGSQINGTIPLASLPAGSTNYIQNTTSPQANSSFNVSGNGVVGGNLGVGTTSPQYKLHVIGQDVRVEGNTTNTIPRFSLNFTGGGPDQKKWQNYATANSLNFSALNDGEVLERVWLRAERTAALGIANVSFPYGNVGIGTTTPATKLHVYGENIRVQSLPLTSFFPRFSLVNSSAATDTKKWQNYASLNGLIFSALNDAETQETTWLQVNRLDGTNLITRVEFPSSFVRINQLVSGAAASVCRDGLNQLAVCSSSIRYKKNVKEYARGLDLINRLRPVSFNWKADNQEDMGLIAEEVMAVEPLLATTNDKGEVEGVKYDRLGVVLVNAIREQQAQIDSLKAQQTRIEALQKENLVMKARLAALERLLSQPLSPLSTNANQENGSEKQQP